MSGLEHPEALALLPVLLLLVLKLYKSLPRLVACRLKLYHSLAGHVGSLEPRPKRLPLVLELAALTLVVLAVSSPYLTVTRIVKFNQTLAVNLTIPAKPALVVALDVSGSMSGYKLEKAKDAVRRLLPYTRNLDLGFIAFSDHVVDALPPGTPEKIMRDHLEALEAGGGTMYRYPLETCLSWLRVYREFNVTAVLVLVTDGLPADVNEYRRLLPEYRRLGIPIHTVFIGNDPSGVRETKLIAKETGGQQFTVANVEELGGVLEKLASRIIARVRAHARVTLEKKVTDHVTLSPWLLLAASILAVVASEARRRAYGLTI